MTYDDWKTTPPKDDDDREDCGCVWVMNDGMRFCVDRCESHQFLYEKNEKRLAAKRAQEQESDPEDSDDIPF